MRRTTLTTLFMLILFTSPSAWAGNYSSDEIQSAVKMQMEKKARFTGKVDIYDDSIDGVRHLDLIAIDPEFSQEGDIFHVKASFKDADTREAIIADVLLEDHDGMLSYKSMSIIEVKAAPKAVAKEWTDQEIKLEMKKHLDAKMKASGTLDKYDSASNKVLNLSFIDFSDDIRRFGKLFIATAKMKDKNTDLEFSVDITMQNEGSKLKAKSVRLKK